MASGESTGFKTGGANNKPNSLLYSPLRTHIRRNQMNNKILRQYRDPGSRAIGISSGAQTNFVRRCLFFIFSLIFHLYFFINMYVQNNKKKCFFFYLSFSRSIIYLFGPFPLYFRLSFSFHLIYIYLNQGLQKSMTKKNLFACDLKGIYRLVKSALIKSWDVKLPTTAFWGNYDRPTNRPTEQPT